MRYRNVYPTRPVRRRAHEFDATQPVNRSHAAIPLALVLFAVGLYLGTITILAPVLIGFLLLSTGGSFLSARVNPFSTGFYLTTKPSWSAIGLLFLVGLLLIVSAYLYWVHGLGPVLPHVGA